MAGNSLFNPPRMVLGDGPLRVSVEGVTLWLSDVAQLYDAWEPPTVIVSDGPYGVGGFPGDPFTPDALAEWYAPHIAAWSRRSTPETTLWFWNTEIGWATVHPMLAKHGWEYRCAHVWDKGIAHIAGNANTKSLRKLPVVSEVCVQYVRKAEFPGPNGPMGMQQWLRYEWMRSGLPLSLTNQICGVKNAATRKYLTSDHLFYYPPVEAFERLCSYANEHGNPRGAPYFSIDGVRPLTGRQWDAMRAKFTCELGITNVWREPAVRGDERIKVKSKAVHLNQKPLKLMELIVRLSSDKGDLVWEPFGGLCTAALASLRLERKAHAAEILPDFYDIACERLGVYSR
ncbi:MAG: site-specific DNA-methyltransferase [Candidatus Omnitrophica bacterium]|nr:site-specific DNA-methyltransferase [Candidatus Omnitrophota bacterium]